MTAFTRKSPVLREVDVLESALTPVATVIELLNDFRPWAPHVFVGVRFFDGAGAEVVPSAGTVTYNVKPITTGQYEPLSAGNVAQAATPETKTVSAPPILGIKATPSGIVGAVNYILTVAMFLQA
jgi:hypothetical protein